jgi:hypothetical protein
MTFLKLNISNFFFLVRGKKCVFSYEKFPEIQKELDPEMKFPKVRNSDREV